MNLPPGHGAVHIGTTSDPSVNLVFVEGIAGEPGSEIKVKREQGISKVKGACSVPVVAAPEVSSGILLPSPFAVYMIAL